MRRTPRIQSPWTALTIAIVFGSGCDGGVLEDGLSVSPTSPRYAATAAPTGLSQISTSSISADSFAVAFAWTAAESVARYEWMAATNNRSIRWMASGLVDEPSLSLRVPHFEDAHGYWLCVRSVAANGAKSPNSACGGFDPPSASIAAVEVEPAEATLQLGQMVVMKAVASDATGKAIGAGKVKWSSSDAKVAPVNGNGAIIGAKYGTTTITASIDGHTASARITVGSAPGVVAVASVRVTPTPVQLRRGEMAQLTATPLDAEGNPLSGRDVRWSSGDAGVAPVNAKGFVIGARDGTATIVATSEGQAGTATVNVGAPPAPPPTPPAGGGGPGLVFRSDWTNGPLGSNPRAITDGGRWNRTYCDMPQMQDVLTVVGDVVPPNTNLSRSLRAVQRGRDGCRNVQIDGFVPRSTSWYLRFYFRNDDNQPNGDHIATIETMGYRPLTFIRKYSSDQGWQLSMYLSGGGASYPVHEWAVYDRSTQQRLRLERGAWYRMEYFIEYIDPVNHPDRFRIWPRVYDAAGNLLYDHRSFHMIDAFGGTSYAGRRDWNLDLWYQSGRYFVFDDLDAARSFGIGNNSQVQPVASQLYWYFAGVEIRTDTWPGPSR